MVLSVFFEYFEQIIANRSASAHVSLHLRYSRGKVRDNRRAWQLHEWDAAVKDDTRGIQILPVVEFPLVGPMVTVAAQPYDDDIVNDGRIDENGIAHVRYRTDGGDVERVFRTAFSRPLDQIHCRRASLGFLHVGQVVGTTLESKSVGGLVQPAQNSEDFFVAFFHTVARPARSVIMKWCGVKSLHVKLGRDK